MTELLARAMEEASLLSAERQDEIARELLRKLLRSSKSLASARENVAERPEESVDALLPCMKVEDRRSWMKDLLSTLEVDEEPIGAEALQKMSRGSGLEPNELSRDLIAAREE